MTHLSRSIFLLFLFSLLPLAAESSEYTLFSPRPLEGELLMPQRGEGVLVKRITIKRGDTLSQISRVFSGRGSYFPQILLFNDITNPNRIFAGKELLVPVSKEDALSKSATSVKSAAQPDETNARRAAKQAGMTRAGAAVPAKKSQRKAAGTPAPKKQLQGSEQLVDKGEQYTYSEAVSAYRSEEYTKALALFSSFLERYPASSMAADAALYKAESLLKLSGQ